MVQGIVCPRCDRQFRWEAELEDRLVQCPCGHVLMARPEELDQVEGLPSIRVAVQLQNVCPLCGMILNKEASHCLHCGQSLAAGAQLPNRRITADEWARRRALEQDRMAFERMMRDRLIPLAMHGLAVVIITAVAYGKSGMGAVLPWWLALAGRLVVGVVFMLVICFFTSRIMKVSFGSLPTAALKAVGIYALSDSVAVALTAGSGLLCVGAPPALLLFFWLLTWQFELDMTETLVFALVMFMVMAFTGIMAYGIL